jgi:hypothetical protein
LPNDACSKKTQAAETGNVLLLLPIFPASLKIFIEHLKAIPPMPPRRAKRYDMTFPLDLAEGEQANSEITSRFLGGHQSVPFRFHSSRASVIHPSKITSLNMAQSYKKYSSSDKSWHKIYIDS